MIRKLEINEIDQFVRLCYQVYEDHYGKERLKSGLKQFLLEEFEVNKVKREIEDADIDYYFISDDIHDAGIIKIRKNKVFPGFEDYRSIELDKLYLLDKYKGHGLGSKTLKYLLKLIIDQDYDYLFLCVEESNEKAIRFYKKLGFDIEGNPFLIAQRFKKAETRMLRMVFKINVNDRN